MFMFETFIILIHMFKIIGLISCIISSIPFLGHPFKSSIIHLLNLRKCLQWGTRQKSNFSACSRGF